MQYFTLIWGDFYFLMRTRKKKNTVPRLERCAEYITDRIDPPPGAEVRVEIGCGKGDFACGTAKMTGGVFYALEKVPDVMVTAVEKAAAQGIENLKFIIADARDLDELCPAASVDALYLNFSDPWPKNRDRKKRLTYRDFLNKYKRVLKNDGVLRVKTDGERLFDFTLDELRAAGFDLIEVSRDLHGSGIDNPVMTEYEKRFSAQGMPIYYVKAKKNIKDRTADRMILKNGTVYNADFEPVRADVSIRGELIEGLGEAGADAEEIYDLTGLTVVPGFIDMHIHGCAGADTGDATPEALQTMSAHLVSKGVTSFCPTSMTLSFEELSRIFANAENMRGKVTGAYIHGINMEGPYIAMSKKGAQNAAYVRNPDKEEFKKLYKASNGVVKIVDIAPECDGAEEFVKEIQPICPVSIAHTDAGYDEACAAMDWGVRHITHLYNAQSGLAHRKPGVVGAAFDKGPRVGLRAELICDGFHIHPAALRIAFRQLGEDGTVIISDSMRAAGHHDGEYDLGGQTVYVRDGKALLQDGTIAASTSNVYDEFKNVLSFGIPFRQALKSVTINPARAIRADSVTGSVEPGKRADLLVLDSQYNIKMVIVKGCIKVNNL